VEGALKLAKRYTGRSEIISFSKAYHGGTHGRLSIMGDDALRKPFFPLLPGVLRLEFNDRESLCIINNDTACVIIEPVQGEAGIRTADRDFILELRRKCSETGTLLVFDEIQTGFGRTGTLFAFEHYGVIPDILVLAKGMGGGLPLGAFIASETIMSTLSHDPVLGHITTFGGNPVCCAASLANLEVILEEKLAEQAGKKSLLFRELLSGLPGVTDFRSAGLMIAVEFDSFPTVKKIIDHCLENGVITDWFLFNATSLRIAPPLNITEKEIRESCQVIRQAVESVIS
jgi:acetylornithine/succinyldiaminopimelate/putrescine aminotransferase